MAENDLIQRKISQLEFQSLVKPMIGLPISRAWRGYGTACFLEIGQLSEYELPSGKRSIKGQFGVMIQWSWRIESPRTIACGSWSSKRKISKGIERLSGLFIEQIALSNRLPEISVCLSSGRWLQSFQTSEGQPGWVIFLREHDDSSAWLKVKNGKVVLETNERNQALLEQLMNLLET
ncbi:MAG: hypothetical protein HC933_18080 [Pleurocapsa sp. SU_196_0]|nr:hypothetical protein [Pleurocapsa sp. SU_196_0]